jgi:alcohol dehydrogenase, propanol-preferring
MHSMQIVEWGRALAPRDTPTPKPQDSEVLLRVEACGVCHSDLHIQEGYFDLGGGNRLELAKLGVKLPHTMGHEIVGEVVAAGPDATGIRVGDKRVVHPWIGCGGCEFCHRGEETLCSAMRSLGARRDGGYADHVIVPHPRYLLDYGELPAELACTYTCSGVTAFTALKKLAATPDRDLVVIIGAGGVGLNAVMLASNVLDCRIAVADIDPVKREAAVKAGATAAFDNARSEAIEQVKAMTPSSAGAAGAIDFVGAPQTAKFGLDILRKGGTLVIVGLYGGVAHLPLPLFPQRVLTVRGSYVGDLADTRELLELVRTGVVPPLPVAARPLREINRVLDELRAGQVVGRIVVRPDL